VQVKGVRRRRERREEERNREKKRKRGKRRRERKRDENERKKRRERKKEHQRKEEERGTLASPRSFVLSLPLSWLNPSFVPFFHFSCFLSSSLSLPVSSMHYRFLCSIKANERGEKGEKGRGEKGRRKRNSLFPPFILSFSLSLLI
jgi:hypothetical protein